jgi:hypothetical protein
MKKIFTILAILSIVLVEVGAQEPQSITKEQYSGFAQMALNCIQKEYPNKTGHVMDDEDDVLAPRQMHPAFYGCFDWHSSVHGHWMLTALIKHVPDLPEAEEIRRKLSENITQKNIAGEIGYFSEKTNRSFERTYGWAWLMKLGEELYTWDDPQAQELYNILEPLIDTIAAKYIDFLPKLTYPNRTGEHPNTAFGMSFAWDWAKATGHEELSRLIEERSINYYSKDVNCPVGYEPGGFDFISPCLAEADMMGRVLNREAFKYWVQDFLPELTTDKSCAILKPAIVTDRSDGKLVHLDGLNLFKAWSLYRISGYFDEESPLLRESANHLLYSTFPNIFSGEYSGEHWLASFAIYAILSGK